MWLVVPDILRPDNWLIWHCPTWALYLLARESNVAVLLIAFIIFYRWRSEQTDNKISRLIAMSHKVHIKINVFFSLVTSDEQFARVIHFSRRVCRIARVASAMLGRNVFEHQQCEKLVILNVYLGARVCVYMNGCQFMRDEMKTRKKENISLLPSTQCQLSYN